MSRILVATLFAVSILLEMGCSPGSVTLEVPTDAEVKAANAKKEKERAETAASYNAAKAERDRKDAEAKQAADAKEAQRLATGDRIDAYIAAQDFVKPYLTQKDKGFAWKPTQVKDQGAGKWFVSSYVDTVNAVNVEKRMFFSANVAIANGKWSLDTLDMWEEGGSIQKIR